MKLRLIKNNSTQHKISSKESNISTIGIQSLETKYSSLEKSGLFVLSSPTTQIARSFIVQTILNNTDNKTALLSFEDHCDLFSLCPDKTSKLMSLYRGGTLSLNFVYIEEYKDFFNKIKNDITGKKFDDYDLIIIDIYQDIFLSMPERELNFLLTSWQSWFLNENKICIWSVYGDQATQVINTKFTQFNNVFNGLSYIDYYNNSEVFYDIIFWHLKSSVQANISLKLQFDEDNSQLSVDSELNKLPSVASTKI